MKTKFYWLALLASAAMIAQANAGGHHGGGGGGGGGFIGRGAAPARGGGVSSFRSAPNFAGGRMMNSGQRFSSAGVRRLPSAAAFRQHQFSSNANASMGARQFTSRNINHVDRGTRFANAGNQRFTNQGRQVNGANQIRHGNNLPSNWRNHVASQHSANWHRDWDRHRDHVWNGHHCRFINGSWVIFDSGFYPWWPYGYGYPYDYYAYGYYPYDYGYGQNDYDDSDVYQGEPVYGDNSYNSSAEYVDSTVVAVQRQLAHQGYYRGQIDGVLGPETSRAIARYQSQNRLRVTGNLTRDTIASLGLRQVASSN